MGVRQKNISGIFRRFLFSFLLAGAATILVLGVIVQILTIKAVIHPANYDEQQLEQKREEIQTAEKVEEKMLPYGTRGNLSGILSASCSIWESGTQRTVSACSGITFAGSAFDFLCGSDVFDPIFQPED